MISLKVKASLSSQTGTSIVGYGKKVYRRGKVCTSVVIQFGVMMDFGKKECKTAMGNKYFRMDLFMMETF